MVALGEIMKAKALIVAHMIRAEIEGIKSRCPGIGFGFLDEKRSPVFSPIVLFDVEGAEPGPKIHTADEVIGDEPCAADDGFSFQEKIPMGQGAFRIQGMGDAVLIDPAAVFRGPALLKIGDGLGGIFRVFPKRN